MVAILWQPSGCCQRFPPGRSLALAGQILQEEFLTPLGVSQYQLAKAVDIPARRLVCQRVLARSQSNRTVPYQARAQAAPQGGHKP
jgi:hypothetical protein